MKGSFDKGWNFGCLQVCLSLPPHTHTHPACAHVRRHTCTGFHSLFILLSLLQGQRKEQRQSGGRERASGTLCPSLPPLMAWALAERYRKGSCLTTFCVCVLKKKKQKSKKEGLLISHDFTGPLMMQPPILILEEEKSAGWVGWWARGGLPEFTH